MPSPQLRGAFIERFTPLPHDTDVDGMATAFTEAMLSTAANIASRAMSGTEGVVPQLRNACGVAGEESHERAIACGSRQ